jgi:hypothetical protein
VSAAAMTEAPPKKEAPHEGEAKGGTGIVQQVVGEPGKPTLRAAGPVMLLNPMSKAEATLIAQLALAGHTVTRGKCDDYNVSKWGYTFYAQDFDALRAFSVKLGVVK